MRVTGGNGTNAEAIERSRLVLAIENHGLDIKYLKSQNKKADNITKNTIEAMKGLKELCTLNRQMIDTTGEMVQQTVQKIGELAEIMLIQTKRIDTIEALLLDHDKFLENGCK